MDGQLGVGGDNSAVPCLMSEFNELAFPKSSTNESEMNSKAPLKVSNIVYIFSSDKAWCIV